MSITDFTPFSPFTPPLIIAFAALPYPRVWPPFRRYAIIAAAAPYAPPAR